MKRMNLPFAGKVILPVAVAIMVACSWLRPLDSAANERIDESLKRAAVSFAIARGINMAFSLIVDIDVAAAPAGVGVNFSPGKLLQAVNNLVEQFAHLMLIATIALGIEKLLMSMGAHWLVSVLFTASALGWIYFYFRDKTSPAWLTKLFMLLLMIRFAMPIVIIGSDIMYQEFMAADHEANQSFLEKTKERLDGLTESVSEAKGVLGKAKAVGTEMLAALSDVYHAAKNATEHIIRVMVVFVMQTLILPVLMLWILWAVVKGTFNVPSVYLQVIDPRRPVHALPDAKAAHPV